MMTKAPRGGGGTNPTGGKTRLPPVIKLKEKQLDKRRSELIVLRVSWQHIWPLILAVNEKTSNGDKKYRSDIIIYILDPRRDYQGTVAGPVTDC